MSNQVVVHFLSGDILKGKTEDFFPNKNVFHLREKNSGEMKQINIQDLKAVYFVEKFEGDPQFNESSDKERPGFGRKIKVQFRDGEVQYGYTQGYAPNRPGFFVSPCDQSSNNVRIFVITGATEKAEFV
ncbi:MAG: hypothetical protein JXK94_00435 [Deltaproteobacteria bacterium]|nr:hypothetical protein [Deltaproteobacteria bacterium]